MSKSAIQGAKVAAVAALFVGISSLLSGWGGDPEDYRASSETACPSSGEFSDRFSGVLTHVRYLADDALAGRAVASAGARCAADYIAGQFAEIGLEPGGDNHTFFQAFPVRRGALLTGGNTLGTPSGALQVGDGWTPYGFSGSASSAAPLVYGGDGINRPTSPENPYPRLDLRGKTLVVEYGDSDTPGRVSLTGTSHFKATVAQGREAAGIIVLLPDGMALPTMNTEARGFLRIPALAANGRAAQLLRSQARRGARVQIDVAVQPRRVEARNVVALIPGSDPAHLDEVVILGAHYDHLGLGGENSLDRGSPTIHNGADDNASGTAAVIEVARRIREQQPRRTVLFMAFTGEEQGLWGSAHYVRSPVFPLDATVAMLNMDMIGRLEGGALSVSGVASAREWEELIQASNSALPTPVAYTTSPAGDGPSDHASFYREGLPVLHFFTGTHPDYHRPSDDWERIDGEGLERVVELVTEIIMTIAGSATNAAGTLTFVPAG